MKKLTNTQSLAAGMVAGVLLIAIIFAVFSHFDNPSLPNYAGTPQTPPRIVNDFILTDQAGKPAHVMDPKFTATFVFFGYTHCPDECPLALATLGRAYRALPPEARAKTRIVFVTVDPKNDTPAALGRYVANFDPHIVALTGSHGDLAEVWRAYGVEVEPQARELVGHGGTIFEVNAADEIALFYPPDVKAEDLTHDANALTR